MTFVRTRLALRPTWRRVKSFGCELKGDEPLRMFLDAAHGTRARGTLLDNGRRGVQSSCAAPRVVTCPSVALSRSPRSIRSDHRIRPRRTSMRPCVRGWAKQPALR